ncbi:MAG TPA: nuclear transport factor 2 family protein [Vicinamibacteria bacterium]|nr:nuclear transport factor 2 family protein [Vicinamibacteria bacterium]
MQAEERVRERNAAFYRALTQLDLDAMERLWLHTDWVRCIHPGWELLIGWRAVRASWEGIFQHTERHRVDVGDVAIHLSGALGWVSCVERIDVRGRVSFTAATNLFQETTDGWRMILHHASIIPVTELAAQPGLVH